MNYLISMFKRLANLSQESVLKYGAQYDAFSLFIFVFYIANPFKWQFIGAGHLLPVTALRFIAVILWLMLLGWRQWPKKLKAYLPLFWHISLCYHLTFRMAFNTLFSEHSPIYDSSRLMGMVALAVLVDSKEFCILTLLGTTIVAGIYLIFGDLGLSVASLSVISYAGLMVLAIGFIKLVFFRNYNQRITEQCKAYKTLAGAIAHEVRSPICTVNIACENMRLISDAQKIELLPIIKKQTRKALSVIDSILLQVGYIEKKNKPLCLSVSLRKALNEALSDTNFSEQESSRIKVELSEDILVLADQVLLVQVLVNLVKNALFATNNLEQVKIVISAQKIDKTVKIIVFDNGIGIKGSLKKQLFYPFLSHSENGAGIGLAFCNLAIKNMNGSIHCESEIGKFTRFIIELDLDVIQEVKPEALMPALTKDAIKLA